MLRGGNVVYDVARRARGMVAGGIGLMLELARRTGLVKEIDRSLHLLKLHLPYHESDHVLNIAYNAMCGGQTLDDIELRRNEAAFLDALGARAAAASRISSDSDKTRPISTRWVPHELPIRRRLATSADASRASMSSSSWTP
jgi:hypothetical protein